MWMWMRMWMRMRMMTMLLMMTVLLMMTMMLGCRSRAGIQRRPCAACMLLPACAKRWSDSKMLDGLLCLSLCLTRHGK